MLKVLTNVFGSRNERVLKTMGKTVKRINVLEPKLSKLSDEKLRAKTEEFKKRLKDGETLNDLLEEAFAVVREASKRTLGLRHFDVQLIGGMVLHEGKIAEMRTGEGKTLVATLPLYLNALEGKGAHLITVNDYLAKRDAEQMAKVYAFLGMTTGVIVSEMKPQDRKAAYKCDITYGTNNEYGFDYLRDNMAFSREEQVQRGLHYCVIDEVDSILIDEARTPLIISGVAEDSSKIYRKLRDVVPKLKKCDAPDGPGDYTLDEKTKQAFLTDAGHAHLEKLLVSANLLGKNESLYSAENVRLMHFVDASLRAHTLFERDVDYMVQNGEVMIVDEHTGRAMPGRRWSDGLHQAIEAKEKVVIQAENQTLASITYQNFFKLFDKLSGMTGTADTEAFELHQIYNLEVVVIPTHRAMIRKDLPDLVYLTIKEKFNAIIDEIKIAHEKNQPVLVGTASIEASEHLSHLLQQRKIKHEVLNAKQHAREAGIVVEAGRPGAVTIATNMAGRGTDIVLGGNWQAEVAALEKPTKAKVDSIKKDWEQRHKTVVEAGGLYIIGSERHESRRIDNQLRGRSGRQGDPGKSRFYVALEDNLLRIFAPKSLAGFMRKMGMTEGEAIESKLVSRSIANAQKKVESYHYDVRKQLLEYDNVANDQRKVIYEQRDELLGLEDVSGIIENMRGTVIEQLVAAYIPPGSIEEQWNVPELERALKEDFALKLDINQWLQSDEHIDEAVIEQRVLEALQKAFQAKEMQTDQHVMKQFEKMILLQTLDIHWREHLSNLDHLRGSINLRGYAQKDPKQEYKREAFMLFSDMLDRFKYEVISMISKVEIRAPEDVDAVEDQWRHAVTNLSPQHPEMMQLGEGNITVEQAKVGSSKKSHKRGEHHISFTGESTAPEKAIAKQPTMHLGQKIGRNDPCPCGSGKKYKHCCGKLS